MFKQHNIRSLDNVTDAIFTSRYGIDCTGLSGSEKAYFTSKIILQCDIPVIVVAPTQKEGEFFFEDICFFAGKNKASKTIYFPSYNILPLQNFAYHTETAAQRIKTLFEITQNITPPVVVTTIDAILQKLIPKAELCDFAELIMLNEEIDQDFLKEKLIAGGFVQSMIVEQPGDYSIRGGIIDIFSPLYLNPIRIELFGDTVDSLRFFSAATQRTVQNINEAVILPAKEAIFKRQCLDKIISRISSHAEMLHVPSFKVQELFEQISSEGIFTAIETLLPLIYSKLDTFFDYLPDNALIIMIEPGKLKKTADELYDRVSQNYISACNEKRLCVKPCDFYLKWSEVEKKIIKNKVVSIKSLSVTKVFDNTKSDNDKILHFNLHVKNNNDITAQLTTNYLEKNKIFLPFVTWVNNNIKNQCSTVIVCSTKLQVKRLKSLLEPYSIYPSHIIDFHEVLSNIHKNIIKVYFCEGRISSGFIWSDESIAVITENEIFGSTFKKKKSRLKSKSESKSELIAFGDLKKKDFIVHMDHGIGQYEGLAKLTVDNVTNDFLLILYQDNDKLYLPVDRMNMINKYMGVEDIVPALHKMGGKSWDRIKQKVKKSVELIAENLLKLYATRKVKKGFAFGASTTYFQDFEAGFSYEETPDQLKAIEDVICDMEKQVPMDRLVCGDVGYGKTEVALRASFKAVINDKQVAVLVPTTVLAQQHYETFCNRFKKYPVNIACLSRFISLKKQRSIVNNIRDGKIDIVIGTHRLFQKDIAFKDLGLFIIDEEQRFGVKDKEKLKTIRNTVDVLTLTATPIPRTLHMSLVGTRDISVISTPPEQRHSIITYIINFDKAAIAGAIRNELNRKGQIFFVHNNIKNIWATANLIKNLVPEIKLDVAHGRLNENELEKVMLQFIDKKIDMLVCTTIIESGLDISSVNTIIVNNADRFGLSQMYQLRGRVGRSDQQAYAYLIISDENTISKNAKKRLKVLMEHSDLGSGFQIAMNDLRIRGGGSILGASQSGHIAAVGYDMFLKLMENTISELKGKPIKNDLEPEININLSSFIPESYIPDIDLRLSAYSRFAKMTQIKEISDFKLELIDRFGIFPAEVSNLLLKIMLKILSVNAGVKRLDLIGQKILLYLSVTHQPNPTGIVKMIAANPQRFEFLADNILKVKINENNINNRIIQVKNILKEISQHVNA